MTEKKATEKKTTLSVFLYNAAWDAEGNRFDDHAFNHKTMSFPEGSEPVEMDKGLAISLIKTQKAIRAEDANVDGE